MHIVKPILFIVGSTLLLMSVMSIAEHHFDRLTVRFDGFETHLDHSKDAESCISTLKRWNAQGYLIGAKCVTIYPDQKTRVGDYVCKHYYNRDDCKYDPDNAPKFPPE